MNFPTAVKSCLNQYATFSGRASRSEYWWFYLFCILLAVLLMLIDKLVLNMDNTMPLSGLFWLLFIPYWSVSVRRLHDIDWRGTLSYLVYAGMSLMTLQQFFLPMLASEPRVSSSSDALMLVQVYKLLLIGFIVVSLVSLVQTLNKGTVGDNKYGPDPLAVRA